MAKKKLTPDQLIEFLNAKIRDRARWRIRDAVEEGGAGSLLGGQSQLSVNPKKLRIVASGIYDDIMSDLSYNELVLEAINVLGKGKFSARYVERVIKRAIKAETLNLEDAKFDGAIAEKCSNHLKGKRFKRKKR